MDDVIEAHIRELYATNDLWLFCAKCRSLEKNPSWMGAEGAGGRPVCSICWGPGKSVVVKKGESVPQEILKLFTKG